MNIYKIDLIDNTESNNPHFKILYIISEDLSSACDYIDSREDLISYEVNVIENINATLVDSEIVVLK